MKNTDKLNRNIFIRDNLEVLRAFDSESVDLIYLDPPFNSNKDYNAPIGSDSEGAWFSDIWAYQKPKAAWWGELADKHPALYSAIKAVGVVNGKRDKGYLIYMAMRLLEMRRVLKDTGSIYLHCDQTMSHSLKLIMDAVFGKENLINEVIWFYKTGGVSKRWFAKKHDNILFYGKTKNYKFNPQKQKSYLSHKYGFKNIKILKDKKGYYTEVGMRDVFDIPALRGNLLESVGYPTQKPIALLNRIIKASSDEGDLVLDPFCGCATTCIASEGLNRRWIGIDKEPKAGELVLLRLKKELGYGGQQSFGFLHNVHIRKSLPIRNTPKPSKDIKHTLFGRQEGRCNGCYVLFEFRHFEKDHIEPLAKGGQDTDKNLQLLCSYCNRRKGTGTMAELKAKLTQDFGK